MQLSPIIFKKFLLITFLIVCFTSLANEIQIMPDDIRSCPPLTGPAQFCDVSATNITIANQLCVGGASNFAGDSIFEGDVIINGTLTVTGITGETGVTGCNTALCAYGYVYNDEEQEIPNGGAILFNSNGLLLGISHEYFPDPTSEIIIEQTGIYNCIFILQLNSNGTVQLKKNGDGIEGSTYTSQSTSVIIGEIIFQANAGDIIQVVNLSSARLFLTAGTVNASVTLMRIA